MRRRDSAEYSASLLHQVSKEPSTMTKWVNRGLRKHLLLGVAWLVADPAFRGQILHSTGTRPPFEVATIKPWKPVAPPPSQEGGGVPKKVMKASPVGENPKISDRVQFIGQTALLIQSAYNLPAGSGKRIVGAPDWVESESNRYQIQAKIEDSLYAAMQSMPSAQRLEQIAWMEQSLLANRFKLRLHFETRDMPVYALVVAKGGPKLTAAKDGEPATLSALANGQGSDMTAKAVTLAEFANSPFSLQRPVDDPLWIRPDCREDTASNSHGSQNSLLFRVPARKRLLMRRPSSQRFRSSLDFGSCLRRPR